jgi:hypothetical protein
MCNGFAPNFGKKRTGCCIVTMHRHTLSFSQGTFLTRENITFIPRPPKLKGRHFDGIEVIEAES